MNISWVGVILRIKNHKLTKAGLSILFVGYILGQVPSNLLLNHFGRPSLYLSFFTIAWGLVSAMTCLCHNFAGIVVCRFILGIVGRLLPSYSKPDWR